jgi:hypothetical protein
MSIIYSEEGALRPFLVLWPIRRFVDVENDRHTVLIITTDYSLVSINSIGGHSSMTSH